MEDSSRQGTEEGVEEMGKLVTQIPPGGAPFFFVKKGIAKRQEKTFTWN